jgi:hypothetical protein
MKMMMNYWTQGISGPVTKPQMFLLPVELPCKSRTFMKSYTGTVLVWKHVSPTCLVLGTIFMERGSFFHQANFEPLD